MLNNRVSQNYRILALLMLASLLLLPQIWSASSPTSGDSYDLYLRIPIESRATGHWLPPYHHGEPRLRKPHLMNWLVGASYQSFGISLFSARLVPFCFALLLLAGVWRLALTHKQGWLVPLLLLGSVFYQNLARVVILDLPLAALLCWAMVFTQQWFAHGRWRDFVALQGALWLAFMLKWVVGLWFFLAALLAYRLVHGRLRVPGKQISLLLGAQIIICSIYPLLLIMWYPDLVAHTTSTMVSNRQPGLHQLLTLKPVTLWCLAMLPWTPLLLAGLIDDLRRRTLTRERQFYWLWIAISITPFLFIKVFARYYMPLLIPATLLLCDYVQAPHLKRWRLTSYILALVLLTPFCFAAWWFAQAPVVSVVCFAAALAAIVLTQRQVHLTKELLSLAIAISVFWGGVYPALQIQAVPEAIIAAAQAKEYAYFTTDKPVPHMPALMPVLAQRLPSELNKNFVGIVFVADVNKAALEKRLGQWQSCVRQRQQFTMLAKHITFIRFYRPDASAADWRQALSQRRLTPVAHKVWLLDVAPC